MFCGRTESRKSNKLGIRLGVRRRLGRGYFPGWRRGAAVVREGKRGDLLQGEEDRSR